MLLAASSAAFAQTGAAGTNYADTGAVQTTNATGNASGAGGSGDAATPGVPNTGTDMGTDPLAVVLIVLAVVIVAGGAYFIMRRPDINTQA